MLLLYSSFHSTLLFDFFLHTSETMENNVENNNVIPDVMQVCL